MTRTVPLLLAASLLTPAAAHAHFHILLPDRHAVGTGEAVTLTYQFGHPFEHELFDTAKPIRFDVLAPDGTKTDLLPKLEKVTVDGPEGKKVTGYKVAFTPEKRGDYVVIAVSPPVPVEGEKRPVQDVVKVIVHVKTQNGWDRDAVADQPEVNPLTRPYGLLPGTAFRVEFEETAVGGSVPLAGAPVEVERYNAAPPKELPAEEFITRVVRTDRVGTATVTLTEAGWWSITANRDTETVRQRATLWVYVDPQAAAEPKK